MHPDSINRGDDSLTAFPYIEITPEAADSLKILGGRMKEMFKQHGFVVVRNVRMFGKNEETHEAWLQKIGEEDERIGYCAGTIASIIHSEDLKKGGITESSLSTALQRFPSSTPITPIRVSPKQGEKFWTVGLNGTNAVLHQLADECQIPFDKVIVLNETYEVKIAQEGLVLIHDTLAQGELPTTIRATPGNVLRDPENRSTGISLEVLERKKETLIERIVEAIKAISDGKTVGFDRQLAEVVITLDRNTLSFHRLSDLLEQGGFHPASNLFLGMEDTRSRASELLTIFKKDGEKALRSALESGFDPLHMVEYADSRLEEARAEGQVGPVIDRERLKIGNELRALIRQLNGGKHSVQKEPIVPEAEYDFHL